MYPLSINKNLSTTNINNKISNLMIKLYPKMPVKIPLHLELLRNITNHNIHAT